MANLIASILTEAQLKYSKKAQDPEFRMLRPATLAAMQAGKSELVNNLSELTAVRDREDRPVKLYSLNKLDQATQGVDRIYNHVGSEIDSAANDVVWETFSYKWQQSLKRQDNNVFEDAEVMSRKIMEGERNLTRDIETAALGYLSTEASLVNIGYRGGVFDGTNWTISSASDFDKKRYFALSENMMDQNLHTGDYNVVADPSITELGSYLIQQGQGNADMLQYQFQNFTMFNSNVLNDVAYPLGLAYWFPRGTVGYLPWIPKQNRAGHNADKMDSYLGGYSTVQGQLGEYALHAYSQRADTSASNGSLQDDVMEFEMSIDIAFERSRLSTAGESTIFGSALV